MATRNLLLRWLGRYSVGIRLAVEYGAGSGTLSEYAYRNVPAGTGMVGRWIDRGFLGLDTWKGLRDEVSTTKRVLHEIIAARRSRSQETVILDIGAGCAPYVRELVREAEGNGLSAYCFDRNAREVELGRALAAKESLASVQFAVGDVLDPASYLIPAHPDLILAIHLFAGFHCDAEVRRIIELAFRYVAPGGYFLATTLAKPPGGVGHWTTRALGAQPAFRTTAQVAEWFRAAGFVEVSQRSASISGVVLGRKSSDAAEEGWRDSRGVYAAGIPRNGRRRKRRRRRHRSAHRSGHSQ